MSNRSLISLILIAAFFVAGNSFAQSTVYTYTGSVQYYTVPANITVVNIECFGAQGGDGQDPLTSPGGSGAKISSDITVTPGEQLVIIVGGKGGDAFSNAHGGGGGGGSFVIRATGYVPLVIAGGGGGGCQEAGSAGGLGSASTMAPGGGYPPAAIGQGGNTGNMAGTGHGTGGGGWYSDGMGNSWGTGGSMQGGPGGVSQIAAVNGGFGGGGAGYHGGGGGGGYTGGGAGDWFTGGGGGGSYNTGTNQVNVTSSLVGDGLVIISPTCSPISTSPVGEVEVCEGSTVTLNGYSNTGGIISWDNGIVNGEPFDPPADTTVYTATSSNPNDCMHSVTVIEIPAPVLTAMSTPPMVCFEQELLTLTGSGADVLTWSHGVQNGVPFYPQAGNTTYILTGTDTTTGCISMETISVFVSNPIVTGGSSDEILGNDGEININVSNGVQPYTFDWDNDGTGDFDDPQNLIDVPGGTYTVTVSDSLGCTVSANYKVNSQLTIENTEIPDFNVYPNPAQDHINLIAAEKIDVMIIDELGRILYMDFGKSTYQIDVSTFESGLYLVKVVTSSSEDFLKLIKQ